MFTLKSENQINFKFEGRNFKTKRLIEETGQSIKTIVDDMHANLILLFRIRHFTIITDVALPHATMVCIENNSNFHCYKNQR